MNKEKYKGLEYDGLRQEILQWQSRRFTLAGTAAVVITAVLGLNKDNMSQSWEVTSSVLLLFLSCICYLAYYCGASNRTLGAYMEKFHGESMWEIRLKQFREKSLRKFINLNAALSFMYFAMGVIAVAVPSNLFDTWSAMQDYEFFYLSLVWFLISWGWLTVSSVALAKGQRERDLKKWEGIP